MELVLLQDVALNSAPSYATLAKFQHEAENKDDQQLSLVSQLQTTLELQQQLDIFSMAAGKIMPLSSLQLNTAVGEFKASGSAPGRHEHRSVLVLNQQCLAELLYHSEYPFTPMLQRELLQRETEWLFALRNALVVARLQQLALKDNLTSLGNRRFFDESLNKILKQSSRTGQLCALLLLDLDNFKQVNDLYGHHTGDDVLLAVSDVMRDTLRDSDSLFRFGGDEFAIILTETNAEGAQLVAHRLVKAINHNYLCQHYNVTASAGLAIYQQEQDCQQFFRAADRALYAAKLAGKSTVRLA